MTRGETAHSFGPCAPGGDGSGRRLALSAGPNGDLANARPTKPIAKADRRVAVAPANHRGGGGMSGGLAPRCGGSQRNQFFGDVLFKLP